jgi:hypothetical protein
MPLERRLSRMMFGPQETVVLRQLCFTPGKMFQPGQYLAEQLPDVAYEMGLVDKLSPQAEAKIKQASRLATEAGSDESC